MKRYILLTLLTILLSSPAIYAKKSYTVEVGAFSKLKITDNVTVVYKCVPDSAGKAVFCCDDNLADAFIFSNPKNETLRVQISPDFIDKIDLLPVVYVYSEFLTNVETSSERRVDILHPVPQPSFKGTLIGNGTLNLQGIDATKVTAQLASGNGTVIVTGKCQQATFALTGTGRIDALDLQTTDVTCRTFGTGNITCEFSGKLVQHGLGSTTIHYRGNPANIKKKGLAKFNRLPEK